MEVDDEPPINAPIKKVWTAVATAEGIASWWMPSTSEPVVGHKFILHAGDFGDSPCVGTACEPPYRVGFSWSKDWHLTFELKALGSRTEFTLVHTGWDPAKATEFGHPHEVVRRIMDSGWEKIVREKLPAAVD
jgi:uncharacterized protein YndB with AHSA1/START domain